MTELSDGNTRIMSAIKDTLPVDRSECVVSSEQSSCSYASVDGTSKVPVGNAVGAEARFEDGSAGKVAPESNKPTEEAAVAHDEESPSVETDEIKMGGDAVDVIVKDKSADADAGGEQGSVSIPSKNERQDVVSKSATVEESVMTGTLNADQNPLDESEAVQKEDATPLFESAPVQDVVQDAVSGEIEVGGDAVEVIVKDKSADEDAGGEQESVSIPSKNERQDVVSKSATVEELVMTGTLNADQNPLDESEAVQKEDATPLFESAPVQDVVQDAVSGEIEVGGDAVEAIVKDKSADEDAGGEQESVSIPSKNEGQDVVSKSATVEELVMTGTLNADQNPLDESEAVRKEEATPLFESAPVQDVVQDAVSGEIEVGGDAVEAIVKDKSADEDAGGEQESVSIPSKNERQDVVSKSASVEESVMTGTLNADQNPLDESEAVRKEEATPLFESAPVQDVVQDAVSGEIEVGGDAVEAIVKDKSADEDAGGEQESVSIPSKNERQDVVLESATVEESEMTGTLNADQNPLDESEDVKNGETKMDDRIAEGAQREVPRTGKVEGRIEECFGTPVINEEKDVSAIEMDAPSRREGLCMVSATSSQGLSVPLPKLEESTESIQKIKKPSSRFNEERPLREPERDFSERHHPQKSAYVLRLEQMVKELTEKVEAQEKDHKKARNDLSRECDDLLISNRKLREEYGQQLSFYEEQISNLERDISRYKDWNSRAQASYVVLKNRLGIEENQNKQLQGEIKKLQDVNTRIQQDMSKYEQQHANKQCGLGGSYLDDTKAATPALLVSALNGVKDASNNFVKVLRSSFLRADSEAEFVKLLRGPVSRPGHIKFQYQAFVSFVLFQHFSNESFQKYVSDPAGLSKAASSPATYFDQYQMHDLKTFDTVENMLQNNQHVHPSLKEFCFDRFLSFMKWLRPDRIAGGNDLMEHVERREHPRQYKLYVSFCKVAVSVWLLDRLALSFQQPAELTNAGSGERFDLNRMQSVVPLDDPASDDELQQLEVGFCVLPGFRIGNSAIPCEVYVILK